MSAESDQDRDLESDPEIDELIEKIDRESASTYRQARFLANLLRLCDERIIEGGVDAFLTEGNPLRAWQVWLQCRDAGVPAPECILAYIDGVAAALLALAKRPPKRVGPAVQQALGFQAREGRGSDLSRYRETDRAIDLALEVRSVMAPGKDGPVSVVRACARVAAQRGVSVEVVRRAWRAHGR